MPVRFFLCILCINWGDWAFFYKEKKVGLVYHIKMQFSRKREKESDECNG